MDLSGEHETSKGDKVELLERGAEAFVVVAHAPESAEPSKAAFDDPAARQENETGLPFWLFNYLPVNVVHGGVFRLFARIALVHEADLNRLPGHFLHPAAQVDDLCPLLFVGRRDDDAQQVAQGVDGDVGLAAFALFGPVVAGPVPALGHALQRPAVEHDSRGRRGSSQQLGKHQKVWGTARATVEDHNWS